MIGAASSRAMLVRYLLTVLTSLAQSAACNRLHSA
jgi:hypothetical protein